MRTVRLGVIGVSPGTSWGFTTHVPAIASLPDARISAVATTREESAVEAARIVGADAWFTDPESLVASDLVDAVVIVVKVPAHGRAVEAAMSAGKPVYCEWPLAPDGATAQKWATIAQQRGLTTAVGLQARKGHAAVQLYQILSQGSLGDIRAVSAHASRARGLAGRPVTRSGAYTLDAANGAGTREVLGGHLLGLIDHLVGIETLSGRALPPNPARVIDDAGGEHVVTAPDTFTATGTVRGGGLLTVSWWDRDPDPCTRIVIHGTRGTAELVTQAGVPAAHNQPQMAPLRLVTTTLDGKRKVVETPESSLPLLAQNVAATYRCFLDDLQNGTHNSAQFTDAAHIHQFLDAGVPRTVG